MSLENQGTASKLKRNAEARLGRGGAREVQEVLAPGKVLIMKDRGGVEGERQK